MKKASHEVLKDAFREKGVKALASEMKLSTSLLYKWCESQDTPDSGGADNPLDRLARIYDLTEDEAPISWLCQHADGFFARNHPVEQDDPEHLLRVTQSILKEFSEMLDAVSRSYDDDQRICTEEAQTIREEWEQLKAVAEGFVVACESGDYHK